MKNLFTGTLALAALGSVAYATPDPKPATTETEWERLDREIGDLASTIRRPDSGTRIGVLVRTYYMHSNDAAFDVDSSNPSVNSGNRVGGFGMPDADLFAEGAVSDIDYRLSFGYKLGATNDAVIEIEDAWARIFCDEGVGLTIGKYRTPVLLSNRRHPENLLLPYRTFSGQILDVYDSGVMVTGDWKSLGGFFSVQNGTDLKESKLLYSSRVEYRLFGGTGRVEGGFGAPDDLRATFGGMWLRDSSNTIDGSAFGVDANATMGPFSAHGEIIHWDGELLAQETGGFGGNGVSRISGNDYFGRTMLPINYAENGSGGNPVKDVDIWSLTFAYFFLDCDVELALRLQGYDDPGNTRSATIGANWYRNGRNAVWYAGLTQVNSNDHAADTGGGSAPAAGNGQAEGIGDALLFMIGLSVGASTSAL